MATNPYSFSPSKYFCPTIFRSSVTNFLDIYGGYRSTTQKAELTMKAISNAQAARGIYIDFEGGGAVRASAMLLVGCYQEKI